MSYPIVNGLPLARVCTELNIAFKNISEEFGPPNSLKRLLKITTVAITALDLFNSVGYHHFKCTLTPFLATELILRTGKAFLEWQEKKPEDTAINLVASFLLNTGRIQQQIVNPALGRTWVACSLLHILLLALGRDK